VGQTIQIELFEDHRWFLGSGSAFKTLLDTVRQRRQQAAESFDRLDGKSLPVLVSRDPSVYLRLGREARAIGQWRRDQEEFVFPGCVLETAGAIRYGAVESARNRAVGLELGKSFAVRDENVAVGSSENLLANGLSGQHVRRMRRYHRGASEMRELPLALRDDGDNRKVGGISRYCYAGPMAVEGDVVTRSERRGREGTDYD
jgi:hypothetical protein